MVAKMNTPIETIYKYIKSKGSKIMVTPLWLSDNKRYVCPDCGSIMIIFDNMHSPCWPHCYHSLCRNCDLEYCDYYSSYCGKKPNNKKAIKIVEVELDEY